MDIFKEFEPRFERASIDEAYFDVGSIIDKQIDSGEWRGILGVEEGSDIESVVVKWTGPGLGVLAFDPTIQVSSGIFPSLNLKGMQDVRLCLATHLSNKIRATVFERLGYTCSAGVAHNKTLAKIASALNKPDNQTIVREDIVTDFMKDLKLEDVRNLGGDPHILINQVNLGIRLNKRSVASKHAVKPGHSPSRN
jgi:DNA polymerase eta